MSHSMNVMSSSKSDEWYTPKWLFDRLRDEFEFTLDAAACETSHICDKYYDINTDGLSKDWSDEVVFCNPPYSDIRNWVKQFALSKASTVVAFVPVRAGTNYWHDYVFPYAKEILIFKGRIKFENSTYSAPFDACLILYTQGTDTLSGMNDLGTLLNRKTGWTNV